MDPFSLDHIIQNPLLTARVLPLPYFSFIMLKNDAARSGNGGMGNRTPDIQLAKLTLYQLSYTPLLGHATIK